ncbi:hypothetical protein, partial [Mesorhizobium sp. M3A.F.Ca.ET.201.01.1.1]|uniref:hypothetical protein n=1 Tax=Mesorhizobium sp. M3A.F.Ca.ET.201.01.1.1 TaxID=2563946 RepID=UPI001AEF2884
NGQHEMIDRVDAENALAARIKLPLANCRHCSSSTRRIRRPHFRRRQTSLQKIYFYVNDAI